MDCERIDHHENNADERYEKDVDRDIDQPLDVGPNFLEFTECLAAALVFKDRIRQFQRVANAVGIDLRTQPLRDDIREIVLEVFRHSRDERHTHRCAQQKADTANEFRCGVLAVPGRVLVDDIPENERIHQRKDLVDRRKHKRQRDQVPVLLEIGI